MRTAQTVLTVIQERGKQHKPIERVYKLLFNRDFYLNAYAKLYPNNGAMTKGVTDETVDGMSIQKIDRMIELLREEKYQWKPARREYIPKKKRKETSSWYSYMGRQTIAGGNARNIRSVLRTAIQQSFPWLQTQQRMSHSVAGNSDMERNPLVHRGRYIQIFRYD